MKCGFKFDGCEEKVIGIYPNFSSLNWLVGDIPVCNNCAKNLIPKKLKEVKSENSNTK